MGWVKRHLLVTSLVGLLLSVGLLTGVVGYLGVVVYAALASGGPVVGPLVELALPFFVALAVLLTVATLSGVGLTVAVLRRLSVPRSQRAHALVDRIERTYSPLDSVVFADFLAPPAPSDEERAERALDDLQRRYVEGELTEAEFERKLDRLVATDSLDDARADRERRAAVEEERSR
ncbi:Short C-terminal domain-containing protein [Halogranum amylolyticum]|uniref:Short C-terminal domain-containing protein n=1 Tax=Halogranum amylolyticum TaxID=660520 RepID=A0A1H8USJ6_9EURY|nr:SHOCT domain-containing protein [Halogranum amylolyticum]SEP06175.1 Short C-terminal domain-containing protein [Halogranum amylolyticum]